MRKILLLTVAAMVVVATGCKGNGGGTPPPAPTPTAIVSDICREALPAGSPPPAGAVQFNGKWYVCKTSGGGAIGCPADVSLLADCAP